MFWGPHPWLLKNLTLDSLVVSCAGDVLGSSSLASEEFNFGLFSSSILVSSLSSTLPPLLSSDPPLPLDLDLFSSPRLPPPLPRPPLPLVFLHPSPPSATFDCLPKLSPLLSP